MKKVLSLLMVAGVVALASCGGDSDKDEKEKKEKLSLEEAAEEFCACKDLEEAEKEECHDEWVKKFKGIDGSREDGEKLGKKMAECDAAGLIKIAPKLK